MSIDLNLESIMELARDSIIPEIAKDFETHGFKPELAELCYMQILRKFAESMNTPHGRLAIALHANGATGAMVEVTTLFWHGEKDKILKVLLEKQVKH